MRAVANALPGANRISPGELHVDRLRSSLDCLSARVKASLQRHVVERTEFRLVGGIRIVQAEGGEGT